MDKLELDKLMAAAESSCDPAVFAKMKVDSFNAEVGNEPYIDCPKCKNKGFIMFLREDLSHYSARCGCMKIRTAFRRMEQSGLKETILEKTFEKFEVRESWQSQILEGARAYAKDPKGWFLIGGQSGCGKTHLCTAICHELIRQEQDVYYMSWREDASRLKSLYGEDAQREEMLHTLKTIPVLYVDDLFKTSTRERGMMKPTAADVNLAFEILNYRYNNRLPTIISTEMYPGHLNQVDEALGSRIMELALPHVYTIHSAPGRNYRLRNVAGEQRRQC